MIARTRASCALVLSLLSVGCRSVNDIAPVIAPADAVILFDGPGSMSGWRAKDGSPPRWNVEGNELIVVPGTGDHVTTELHGDGRLHVEFWLPDVRGQTGQHKANSGVYLHGRYEIQVLDVWNNAVEPLKSCAALYGILAPRPGAIRPPERWQSYDIHFRAPRASEHGVITKTGELTVVHNGQTVIDVGLFGKTTAGGVGAEIVERGPLLLQDHGNPVRFRNIWFVPEASP